MTFEEFAAAELAPLVRFATVLTNDRGLAEDVCQEVLLRVRERWSRIAGYERPVAYVRQMIVNEHLSWRRKWGRFVPHAEVVLTDTHDDHAEHIAAHRELLDLVGALPLRQRTALVLRFYEDLPDREIAALMSCRESTVRGYIHRALKTLRIELHPGSPAGLMSPAPSRKA